MTLLLAAVTRGFAVLACDRRITYSKTDRMGRRQILSREDTDSKSFVIDDRYLMGFAGLGRFPTQAKPGEPPPMKRLESWVMDAWSMQDGADFEALAAQTSDLVQDLGWTGRHAYIAVGYQTGQDPQGADAELVRIENAVYPQSFDVTRTSIEDAPYLFDHAGVQLLPEEEARVHAALKQAVKRRPRQPFGVCHVFADTVRSVAARVDGVGPTAVVSSMPRTVAGAWCPMTTWLDEPPSSDYFDLIVSWNHVATTAEAGWQHQPAVKNRWVDVTAGVSSTTQEYGKFIELPVDYSTSRGPDVQG